MSKVKDVIKDVLSDLETYKSNVKKFKAQVSSGDKDTISLVLSTTEFCLTDSSVKPIAKLNALRLLKETMDTKNTEMIKKVSKNKVVLEKMFELSKFDHTSQNDDRGSYYYGEKAGEIQYFQEIQNMQTYKYIDQQMQVIGNSLIRLSLECFLFWSYLYQTDLENQNATSSYLYYYEQLVELGVKFPEKINYFKQALKEMQQQAPQDQQSQGDSQTNNSEPNQQRDLSQDIDVAINQFNNSLLSIEMVISNEKNDKNIDQPGLDNQFQTVDEFVNSCQEFLKLINQNQNLESRYKQYLLNLQKKGGDIQKCYKQYKQKKYDFIKFRNEYLELSNKELLQIILDEEEQERKQNNNKPNIFLPSSNQNNNVQNLEIEDIDEIDYGNSKTSSIQNKQNIFYSGSSKDELSITSSQNNKQPKKIKQNQEDSPRLFYYKSGEQQNTKNITSEERKSSTRYDDNDEDDIIKQKEDDKDMPRQVYPPNGNGNTISFSKSNTSNTVNVRDSFGNYSSNGLGSTRNDNKIQINNNIASNFSSSNNTPAFRIGDNTYQESKTSSRDQSEEVQNLQRSNEEKQMQIQRLTFQLNAKAKEQELIEKEVKINKDEKEMYKRESDKLKLTNEQLENQINVIQREKKLIIDEKELLQQKLDNQQNKIDQLTDKTIQSSQQMTDYQIIASENSQIRQELYQLKNYHQEIIDSHEKRESEFMLRIRENEKEKAQRGNEYEREKLKLNEKISELKKQINGLEEQNRIQEENIENAKKISLVVDEQKNTESKKTQSLTSELQNKKSLIDKYEEDNDRLTKQIVLLKTDMKRSNEYLNELETQVNSLNEEKDQLNNKIQELLQQLSDERAKVMSQQQIDYEQAIVNADQKFQNEKMEYNLKIEKLELDNMKQQKEISQKKEHIEQLNQNVIQLNELIQQLKEQSRQSNHQIEQQSSRIKELNNLYQKTSRSCSVDLTRQINTDELNHLKVQIEELQNERNMLKREIDENRNSKMTYRSGQNSSTSEAKGNQTEIEEKLQYQQKQIDNLNSIIQQLQSDNLKPKTRRDYLEIQTSDHQNMHNFDQTFKSTQYSNFTGGDMGRLDSKATPTSKPPIYVRDSMSEDQTDRPLAGLNKNQLSLTQNLNPMMLKLSNITTNSSEYVNQLQALAQQQKLMQDLFATQGFLSQTNPINTSLNMTKPEFSSTGQSLPNKILHSEPASKSPQSRQFCIDQLIGQQSLPQSVKNSRGLITIEEEQTNKYRRRPSVRCKSNMQNYSNTSNMLNLSDYLRSKTPQQSGLSSTTHSHNVSNNFLLGGLTGQNGHHQSNSRSHPQGNSMSRQESRDNSRCDSRISSDFLNISEQRNSQDNTLYLEIENADYHLSTNNNTSFNVNPHQQVSVNIEKNTNLHNTPSVVQTTFGQRSQSQQSSKNYQNAAGGMNTTLQPNRNIHQVSNLYDTENFATSTTNQQISSITPSERLKCDFFFQQLIYPFQKPDDYYNSRNKSSNSKGQIVKFNNLYSQNYQNQFNKVSQLSVHDKENFQNSSFDRFRKACLLEKGVIAQSNVLKVGTLSSLHFSSTKKYFLKITVHFLNVSKQDITQLSYVNVENQDLTVKMNPSLVKCDIPSEHKIKVDILYQISKNPYVLPEGSILLNTNGKEEQIQILLPATLNKFMQFKNINLSQFKQQWQYVSSKNVYKSSDFEYSSHMLKHSFNITKYFPQLIELTPFEKDEHVAGISDFKVGGLVTFIQKENSEYMVKFIFKPLQRMQIQFSVCNQNQIDETDTNIAEYFINTIYFLFKC